MCMKKARSIASHVGIGVVCLFAMRPSAAAKDLLGFPTSGGSAVAEIAAPQGLIQAQSHLMTNVPAAFNGAIVNNLVGANTFYNNGITGQGTVIANVEAGLIWNGQESLGHVSQFSFHSTAWNDPGTVGAQQSDLYDRHATWVGAVLGGRTGGASQGQWQTGIAGGADLRSGALASSWSGAAYAGGFSFNFASFATPYNTFFGSANVVNSSWGFTDVGGSNFFTVAMDGVADDRPSTTFVVSAGNSGPNPDTVGSPGSGYNAITVGAFQNNSNIYNSIATFSSRGPQSYHDPVNGTIAGVRAAVDITAPGTNLTAAFFGGQAGGNNPTLSGSTNNPGANLYSSAVAGTSFSSPIVAGGAALIHSASLNDVTLALNAASRDARVVKAVLLNSADKVPGWNNGQIAHTNGNGGVLTQQALDYTYGTGAMNLDRAYDNYMSGTRDVAGTLSGNLGVVAAEGWDFGIVQQGVINSYNIATPLLGGSAFTLTLTWFRDRSWDGVSGTALNNAQVDLDLSVVDTVTGLVISESVSDYNVVEHLHFTLPSTSLYRIDVNYFQELFDLVGTSQEQYGLAWSGTAVPEPASCTLLAFAGVALLSHRWRSSKGIRGATQLR